MTRRTIEHSDGPKAYPLVDSPATLTWLGQIAALELHVPQWRFGAMNPSRCGWTAPACRTRTGWCSTWTPDPASG